MSRNVIGRRGKTLERSAGFTLIEAMIAIVILSFGILGLAAMMTDGIAYMGMSQADYIAQQKAEEAIESVFYARDSQLYTWAQIQNVVNGGIFADPAEQLCDRGPDGIIDTADDNCANLDTIFLPDPAAGGTLTAAKGQPLSNYTRTIVITDVPPPKGQPVLLRQITVTINYTAGKFVRQYTLTSYICKYS